MAGYVLVEDMVDGVYLRPQANVTADNWRWAELAVEGGQLVEVIFVSESSIDAIDIEKYNEGYWDVRLRQLRCITREEFEQAWKEAGL